MPLNLLRTEVLLRNLMERQDFVGEKTLMGLGFYFLCGQPAVSLFFGHK